MFLMSSAYFFQNKLFRKTIRVSKYLDPDQSFLIWVQTASEGYKQTTKVATSKERVKIIQLPSVWDCQLLGVTLGTHRNESY